jgi:receptor expression-enhancing protein 5/6
LNNLEKQTSIPKVYAFLGLIALYFAFIFFNIAGQLLTNVAGFVIPGYYSLEALFSVGKADDTQWLTVCSSTSTFERLGLTRFYSTGWSLLSSPSSRAPSTPFTGSHSTIHSSSFLFFGSHSQSLGKFETCLRCDFQPLTWNIVEPKLSSAPSSSQYLPDTSLEPVQLLPTCDPRSTLLPLTRPCKRDKLSNPSYDCQDKVATINNMVGIWDF